jgi:general stress protein 26
MFSLPLRTPVSRPEIFRALAEGKVSLSFQSADDTMMPEYAVHSTAGDLAELIRIIRDIRIALLTTVGSEGQFHTRPVQTLQVEADATLWFFTDWTSPKVAELDHDVRVGLGYSDIANNVYVALSGEAHLFRDPQKAKELWSIEQRAYYPKGPDDERLALLRVAILHAEYWIAPGRTSYLIAAVKAGVTGVPTEVIGENHKVE